MHNEVTNMPTDFSIYLLFCILNLPVYSFFSTTFYIFFSTHDDNCVEKLEKKGDVRYTQIDII